MDKQKSIKTERLTLRPFQLSDAKRVQLLAGDKRIAETTLNIPHPYENGMAESWIESHHDSFIKGISFTYAIIEKESNVLIGAIGLMINSIHRKAELGYWIGVQYWGKGYCTEASKAVIKLGFEYLNLNKIFARALVSNVGSWTVMEKIGMFYEGTLRHEVIKDGIPYDLKSYAILKEDYDRSEMY